MIETRRKGEAETRKGEAMIRNAKKRKGEASIEMIRNERERRGDDQKCDETEGKRQVRNGAAMKRKSLALK